MSKLSKLREERSTLVADANALNARYPADVRMPKAASDELQNMLDRIASIDAEIKREGEMARDAADGLDSTSSSVWMVDGKPVSVLRSAKDVRAHYSRATASAGLDGAKMTLTDFVRGVAGMGKTEAVRAALSIGTDTSGGFLVPGVVMPQILEALIPASSCLSAGAGMIMYSEGAKQFTYAGIDSVPTPAWRQENGAVAESDPSFRAVVAAPKSLAFMFKMSRELLADAAGMEDAVRLAIAQAFAKALDRVALMGSGTAPEPAGLLNIAGVNALGNGTNGASLASTKFTNYLDAAQLILDNDAPFPTAAIMSNRSGIVMGKLTDSTGQPLRRPEMLANTQFLQTSQIPNNLTVGTSTDCSRIFMGDFTRMYFAMREGLSIKLVDQLFAGTGQIGLVCHVRADILVTYPKAFAIVTGVRP